MQYFRISKVANHQDQSNQILKFLSLRAKEKKCKDQEEIFSKTLKVGAAGGVLAVSAVAKVTSDDLAPDDNGVVVGKSNKKEVLYKKSKNWETYYKIAY